MIATKTDGAAKFLTFEIFIGAVCMEFVKIMWGYVYLYRPMRDFHSPQTYTIHTNPHINVEAAPGAGGPDGLLSRLQL